MNPVDVAMSLAKGAKDLGVKYFEGITYEGVRTTDSRVSAVVTDHGVIDAEVVINCTGMWARQVGATDGVLIPNQAAEHYYLLTDPIDSISQDMPIIEDPSSYTYIRPETNG